jgi:hypothetical protein
MTIKAGEQSIRLTTEERHRIRQENLARLKAQKKNPLPPLEGVSVAGRMFHLKPEPLTTTLADLLSENSAKPS